MKIAIATQSMVLGYGISEVVNIISKELAKMGHEVTILTTESRFPTDNASVNVRTLPPIHLSLPNDYWQRNFLADVRSAGSFSKAARKHDIMITCDPMHLVGAAAKIRFKKPVIMYYFGITPYSVLGSFDRRLEFFRQTLVWNISFGFGDYLMVNSKYTKDLLPRNLRGRALVNYHGIEHLIGQKNTVEQFRRKLGIERKKTIMSVGRFSTPYKGMIDAAKMFMKLKKKRDDLALLMIGGGNLPDDMKSYLSLEDAHVFTNIPYETLKLCFASCDIYYTASRWEGFDLPLVAAQANQKPIVAFDVGAHSEVAVNEKTGFLVKDHEEFENRLEVLLDDDSLRARMGKEASEFASRFSWQRSMDKLNMLIDIIQEEYGL